MMRIKSARSDTEKTNTFSIKGKSRLTGTAIAALLAASLSACGGSSGSPSSSPQELSEELQLAIIAALGYNTPAATSRILSLSNKLTEHNSIHGAYCKANTYQEEGAFPGELSLLFTECNYEFSSESGNETESEIFALDGGISFSGTSSDLGLSFSEFDHLFSLGYSLQHPTDPNSHYDEQTLRTLSIHGDIAFVDHDSTYSLTTQNMAITYEEFESTTIGDAPPYGHDSTLDINLAQTDMQFDRNNASYAINGDVILIFEGTKVALNILTSMPLRPAPYAQFPCLAEGKLEVTDNTGNHLVIEFMNDTFTATLNGTERDIPCSAMLARVPFASDSLIWYKD